MAPRSPKYRTGTAPTELWLDVGGNGGTPSGSDQLTQYVYGVTPSDSPGASEITANNLLRKVVYPFESPETEADNRMLFAYNAQGEEIWVKDQIGYEMESSYDTGSRLTERAFTNAGSVSGLDESVLRVEFGYSDRGQVETVTQYDAASSGTATDGVEFAYDGWGNVTEIHQDRDSAVALPSGNHYTVEYGYSKSTSGRHGPQEQHDVSGR